ncbi:MAG: hypothetical protein AB7O63_15515, partial [Reyranellaceae bacterium]
MALAPLEQHLQRLLGVKEVCLFGQGREELVIGIEAAIAPPAEALRALEAEFGAFQRARSVVLPAFPRALSGMAKVRRSELRKQLLGHGRAAHRADTALPGRYSVSHDNSSRAAIQWNIGFSAGPESGSPSSASAPCRSAATPTRRPRRRSTRPSA